MTRVRARVLRRRGPEYHPCRWRRRRGDVFSTVAEWAARARVCARSPRRRRSGRSTWAAAGLVEHEIHGAAVACVRGGPWRAGLGLIAGTRTPAPEGAAAELAAMLSLGFAP